MTKEITHEDLWKELEKYDACMLITRDGGVLRGRPMHPRFDDNGKQIHFVTSVTGHKDEEIAAEPEVALSFTDNSGETFISLSGRARVSNDRAKLKQIWNHKMDAWFKDGAEDPAARLLSVDVEQGEIWDGPSNRLVASLKLAVASATGSKPDMGDNKKLAFR